MRTFIIAVAILGASLLWGSTAKAQCVNGQCVQFVPVGSNVIVGNAFAPSFVVPSNGIFFQPSVVVGGFGRNVVAVNGLGANVVVANRGFIGRNVNVNVAGRGRNVFVRNGLLGTRVRIR